MLTGCRTIFRFVLPSHSPWKRAAYFCFSVDARLKRRGVKVLENNSAQSRTYAKMSGSPKLDEVPEVDIDHGRFKYILIKIYDTSGSEEKWKHIVRGYSWAAYHADIFEKVDKALTERGIESECVGGGRILHDIDKKTLSVFGYSTGYGKADHAITTEILKKNYPDYTSITWSNDGY